MSERPDGVDKRGRLGLDSASGLPLDPAAREVLHAALDEGWADPLRLYREARQARLLLDNAREVMASVLGARADEVSFVSSGTTACHAAVLGYAEGRRRLGRTVVHSAVEHSAVISAAHWLEGRGGTVRAVPVDEHGRVDADAFVGAVGTGGPAASNRAGGGDGVAVACLQAANHEVGTVQPVEAVADGLAAVGVPLVVDAAAAVGWAPVPRGWSALVASAHKWGGPAGVGVLAVRKGTRWRSPWPGDERDRVQAGYVNVPAVLAAAAALQAVTGPESAGRRERMRELTSSLRATLAERIADVSLAGHPRERLPHIVNFSCLYVDGEALVTELDRGGFAVSSGSACTSSALEPSHVLAAMGVLTHGNVRVSLSAETTRDDLERFFSATLDIVTRLRSSTGLAP